MAWVTPIAGRTGQLIDGTFMNTNVSDPLTFLHDPPACRLTGSGSESIASSTVVKLTGWDTEDIDNDGMHSTTTDPENMTVVTAGMYVFSLTAMVFTQNATGRRFVTVQAEAAGTADGVVAHDFWSPGADGTTAILSATGLDQFQAADVAFAEAGQSSGTTLTISTARVFSAHWLGGP